MDIERIRQCCVQPGDSINHAMHCLRRSGRASLVPVTDSEGRLLGIITDPDLRSAFLSAFDFNRPVGEFLDSQNGASRDRILHALPSMDAADLISLMQENELQSLPIVDEKGRPQDVVLLNDLTGNTAQAMQALVMAGGLGTRLLPLTEDTPKPMLKLNGRPVLELIIRQLRNAGVQKVFIATHYRTEKISDHFGDGSALGVEIEYLHEEAPLGTGGALGLLPEMSVPLLVINGDILTQVSFSSVLNYHKRYKAVATIGVRKYDVHVPYGVVNSHGINVSQIEEKPSLHMFVNAGVYILDPIAFQFVERGRRFDMPDLIKRMLDAGRAVVSFPIFEYWLDIGRIDNFMQAQQDILTWDETQ